MDPTSARINIFNPLAKTRHTTVSVPLNSLVSLPVGVVDATTRKPVIAQLSATNESVYFVATTKSLSSATYILVSDCTDNCAVVPTVTKGAMTLKNDNLEVEFSHYGLPTSVNGMTAHHQYAAYNAEQGGPYVLIETAPATPLPPQAFVSAWTHSGPILQEVAATFDLSVSLDAATSSSSSSSSSSPNNARTLLAVSRVYASTDEERAGVVEIEHYIPGQIGDNMELIMHVSSGIANEGNLWTDESGLEMHQRPYNSTLPISGNYHVRNTDVMSGIVVDVKYQIQLFFFFFQFGVPARIASFVQVALSCVCR